MAKLISGMATGLVLAVLAVGSSAVAEPPTLPLYDGSMSFPAISGSSGPEEFSWEVSLAEGQELQQLDDQHAAVFYSESHLLALSISAGAAHDAVGSTVPTSLVVSEGNVITLVVHHRAGNPAAGGAPFEYPVLTGEGWPGGVHDPIIVKDSMDEQKLQAPLVFVPVGFAGEYVSGPSKIEPVPWRASGYSDGEHTFAFSVKIFYCAGDPRPQIDGIRVVERPMAPGRMFKSAVITVFARFPTPRAVVDSINPDGPQRGCSGIGIKFSKRVKLKRPVRDLTIFDGSFSTPRRMWPPAR